MMNVLRQRWLEWLKNQDAISGFPLEMLEENFKEGFKEADRYSNNLEMYFGSYRIIVYAESRIFLPSSNRVSRDPVCGLSYDSSGGFEIIEGSVVILDKRGKCLFGGQDNLLTWCYLYEKEEYIGQGWSLDDVPLSIFGVLGMIVFANPTEKIPTTDEEKNQCIKEILESVLI